MTIADDTRPGIIYALLDPRDNAVRYVGKTVWTAERRLDGHIRHATTRGKSHCSRWIAGLLTKDLRPVMLVLETVPSGDGLLNFAERQWIARYRALGADLCNQTDGGDGGSTFTGRKHSDASKAKTGAANRKEANPERARKISEAKKRQWQDPEYRAKMTAAGRRGLKIATDNARGRPGHKHTEETKAKIKNKLAGREISPETRKKISKALRGSGKTHPPGWADKVRATRARKKAERLGGDE